MHGHASTEELKISCDYKIETWFTSSRCRVMAMTRTDPEELIKCNYCLFYFFKKTSHFLLHYSINKNTLTAVFFSFFASRFL